MFSSLRVFNYRLWFGGALVSNTGTWMQATAQDWLVLTHLTNHNATALGVTMALQFLPPILMIPITGLIAERYDRRRMLMVTQASMGALGLALGLLVVTDVVQLWMVWAFALVMGIVQAVDAPIRQSFVSELVPPKKLTNAVSLNSASFNGARLIGPAVAGVLIAAVGTGPVFLINAASFLAVLASLRFIRVCELEFKPRVVRAKGQIREGFGYVRSRPDLIVVFIMIFIIGTFGMNFPIFTSTMATGAFHVGSDGFGLLTSAVAVGSLTGALLSARRERPRMRILVMASISFGVTCTVAALMPTYWSFAAVLVTVGLSSITLMTTANGTVQLGAAPEMRGRVMALYMAIFTGGTPIGAPIVGWVANTFGPREAIGVGAAAGFVAAGVALTWLVRSQHLRVRHNVGHGLSFRVRHDGDGMPATEAILVQREEAAAARLQTEESLARQ
ncbi:putative MFS family arabinose efflux permease [Frondihabitans australicus]|uniref:Putative MFS family arabinose efflux permease n=2 Tax=Frondihabitans australicus TaxID=386892 RepID=A0A495IJV4_9MICO|nr:putative MFS family arabinose efflux permease [Frondihabitans australicus]